MDAHHQTAVSYPDPTGVPARDRQRRKEAAAAEAKQRRLQKCRRRRLRWRRVRNGVLVLVLFALAFFAGAPLWRVLVSDPELVFDADAQASLIDRSGGLYMTWPEFGDRRPVPYKDLSEHLVNAVIAREDQRFRRHPGVDPIGIGRAAAADLKERSLRQGGSTITMQLVEVVYRYPQDSTVQKLRAKIFELMMAPRLEWYAAHREGSRAKGKKAILAAYLSRVEFGNRTVGIREAAHCYFGKKPAQLTLGESAYLAGLIRGPSANNVYRNPGKALDARDAVVGHMQRRGMISSTEADSATFYVRSRPLPKSRRGDGFTSAAVRRELDRLVAAGELPNDFLGGDQLKIFLACDFRIHDIASRELSRQLTRIEAARGFRGRSGQLQGAVVVIDNHSGALLTSVGGRNFDRLSYDCALQGRRTVASAGKPFVYAAFMEKLDLGIDSILSNAGLGESEARGWKGLRYPKETEALKEGVHPLWKGLAFSSNRMTMRAGAGAGMTAWEELLKNCRLADRKLARDTAMWLGSFEVRPADLAAAYSIFPRGGLYIRPWLIERVQVAGKNIFEREPVPVRILSKRVSDELTAALREVLTVGTASRHGGRELASERDVAGKTGTSDEVFDAWFVGYGSELTMAVWIGFPDGNRTILDGGTGGSLAFPLWKNIVEALPEEYGFGPMPVRVAPEAGLTLSGN